MSSPLPRLESDHQVDPAGWSFRLKQLDKVIAENVTKQLFEFSIDPWTYENPNRLYRVYSSIHIPRAHQRQLNIPFETLSTLLYSSEDVTDMPAWRAERHAIVEVFIWTPYAWRTTYCRHAGVWSGHKTKSMLNKNSSSASCAGLLNVGSQIICLVSLQRHLSTFRSSCDGLQPREGNRLRRLRIANEKRYAFYSYTTTIDEMECLRKSRTCWSVRTSRSFVQLFQVSGFIFHLVNCDVDGSTATVDDHVSSTCRNIRIHNASEHIHVESWTIRSVQQSRYLSSR